MSTATRAAPPAGRRFWLTVLCFALANSCAWIAYLRYAHPGKALLEVRQSAPRDAALVGGRPTFWWTFNLDVAPDARGLPPGQIRPPISGRWTWDNPRTLSFVPDRPLPKATEVSLALLPQRLHTPDGFALKRQYVTTVHTAPLEVLGVRQAAIDERDRLVLEIEFDDQVIPAEVLAHLKIKTADGHPVAFHPQGGAIGRTVRVLTDPLPLTPADASKAFVKVSLSPGLAGRSGPLPMPWAYSCNLPIGTQLMATGADVYASGHDQTTLALRFNNPVQIAVLRQVISVDPPVPFTLSGGYSSAELHGAFQPATRYAIRLAKPPAGIAPSACPRADVLSVYVPDLPPEVWFEHEEGYLGSAGNRTLLAHAVNVPVLRASITRIYDNNLVTWRNNRGGIGSYDQPIASKVIKLPPLKNKTQDLRISLDDLLPASDSKDGVYRIGVETVSGTGGAERENNRHGYGRAWGSSAVVTLSDIGLTAKSGRSAVTVWATSLRTAQPLAHVRVRLFSNKNQFLGQAITNADGLARIDPVPSIAGEEPSIIVADRPDADPNVPKPGGRNLTWLDLRTSPLSFPGADTGGAPYLRSGYEAFIYTDRGVYRPGETVHLRAIVRGPGGATPGGFPIQWRFRRPDSHAWRAFSGKIDSDGMAGLDLPLPTDLPTGRWTVTLGLPRSSNDSHIFGEGSFSVEEFMPNAMQVAVKLTGTGHSADGGDGRELPRFAIGKKPIAAQVQADYLFGRPVSARPARIAARLDPVAFAPAQWQGWSFGDVADTASVLEGVSPTGHRIEVPEQTLDAKGHANFDLDVELVIESARPSAASRPRAKRRRSHSHSAPAPVALPRKTDPQPHPTGPWRLTVTASVIGIGGRAVSASAQADLDPLDHYIGLRAPAVSISPTAPARFEVALVRPDGRPFTGPTALTATLYRESWNNSLVFEKGQYVYHSTRLLEPLQKNVAVRTRGGKGVVEFQPPGFGAFVVRISDPQTGGMASLAFYAGDGAWQDNISRENPGKLELIVRPVPGMRAIAHSLGHDDLAGAWTALQSMWMHSSRQRLRPGQMAQVIVRSPFAGWLLLSIETDDVVSTHVIAMTASSMAVPIRIPASCGIDAYVTASVVRAIDPDAPWRTHRAAGAVRVPLENRERKLAVQISSPQSTRPSSSFSAQIRVTDSAGKPVPNAAVTLAAVDEGICQLTGFATPDPFAFFTRNRALGVNTADLYSQLMPEVPRPRKVSATGGDKGSYDPRHTSPVSAKRIKPVALMSATLHTDSDGVARTTFNVPEFTGRLRLMAVTCAGAASGSGEDAVLVRSPLLVQSSWPRFAAPTDRFLVPLLVFNNSASAGEAKLTLHVIDGPLEVDGGREISLPPIRLGAHGQAAAAIQVTALSQCGVAHAVLVATLGNERYKENVELPIRPANPEISMGGYAVATPAKPAAIAVTGGMLEGTMHLHVNVTPWPTLELPRGLDYLERYPYGCLEQTTSTLFPLVYLSDIGRQIAPGVFEPQRVKDKVQVGITRLIGMQTTSGGLAMWPGYREPWPWGSVYAAHFLVEARAAGHMVPDEFFEQVLGYVRGLLTQSSDDPDRLETQAYACYVLALAGKPQRAAMSRLTEVVRTPRPDGIAYASEARLHLAAAWLAAGRRDLAEGLIPHVLPAPRTMRQCAGVLGSPVRDRAVLIDTLLAVQPDHPSLPALVQQLADAGRNGGWRSTQDTAMAVLAIGRYLRQARSAALYDRAALRVGNRTLAAVESGHSLAWDADSKWQRFDGNSEPLGIDVAGPASAKAYVAWIESGVPIKPQPASDNGMKVRRQYFDEHGKPIKTNTVRSGDLIQVELSISSPTPLRNLVIDDLLPAGLEIENPRLATTAAGLADPPANRAANAFADSRIEMRDDRMVVMGDLVSAGAGRYVYTARAVTRGHFVLPPVHAECMYDLGMNSLSGGGFFDVAGDTAASRR